MSDEYVFTINQLSKHIPLYKWLDNLEQLIKNEKYINQEKFILDKLIEKVKLYGRRQVIAVWLLDKWNITHSYTCVYECPIQYITWNDIYAHFPRKSDGISKTMILKNNYHGILSLKFKTFSRSTHCAIIFLEFFKL